MKFNIIGWTIGTGKPQIFLGKSMVSGEDFPVKTNPLITIFEYLPTLW